MPFSTLLFQREAGYEKVVRLLEQARRSPAPMFLNAVNLGEIVYSTKRAFGDQKKIEVLARMERLGLIVLPVFNDLIFRAAEYKAGNSLSFADCFALASAVGRRAVLVTGDPGFKAVELLVKIAWVQPGPKPSPRNDRTGSGGAGGNSGRGCATGIPFSAVRPGARFPPARRCI